MGIDREEALDFMRSLTKEAIASPPTARPGPGMDQMGMGMAPWAIKQQPVTASVTKGLMGQKLVPFPATKSQQKKMTGSVMASAERQKPKKNVGGLIGKTDPILSDPNAVKTAAPRRKKPPEVKNLLSRLTGGDIAIAGGISGAGTSIATYDQLSEFNKLMKGHEKSLRAKARNLEGAGKAKASDLEKLYKAKAEKLPRFLKWYAKRKGVPEAVDLAKHVPEIEKQIPKLTMTGKAVRRTALKSGAKVGGGAILALVLARALSRKSEQSKRLQTITNPITSVLDAKDVKLAFAQTDLEKTAYAGVAARVFGWGKGLLGRMAPRATAAEASLPTAGKVFSSGGKGTAEVVGFGNKARAGAKSVKDYLWARGTGRKNVYRHATKVDDAGKPVEFLSSKSRWTAPKDWELVKHYDQTGGMIQRGAKGLLRGGAHGALGGYGLSWALNQDAAWNDPRRGRMAAGGALMYPGLRMGNQPAMMAAIGAGVAMPKTFGGLVPGGIAAGQSMWGTKGDDALGGGKRYSNSQIFAEERAKPQRAAEKKWRAAAKRQNAAAYRRKRERKAREAIIASQTAAMTGANPAQQAQAAKNQARQDKALKKGAR